MAGRLLVATPMIADANFERTVVALLDHGDEGSLGLVLNRPSDTTVVDPLPEWDRFAVHPAVVFLGGPVQQERAIALARPSAGHRTGDPDGAGVLDDAFDAVVGDIGTLDLHVDPDRVGAAIDQVRVFSGYAGWGPGQLEGELEAGAWWVVDARPDDLLCEAPEQLWRGVLARQPGDLATFARYPDDPSAN